MESQRTSYTQEERYQQQLLERRLRDAVRHRSWRIVCQPIVSLADGSTLGYEALARPNESAPLDAPDYFLTLAGKLGLARDVESLWRTASLEEFGPRLPEGRLLFLNGSPLEFTTGTIRASVLAAEVKAAGLSPDGVVLEITEGDLVEDFAALRRALGAFRSAGFLIAIDDVGAGPSSLQAIAELRPNFIKLDRWLSTDIAFDGARRAIVESMVELARRTRARVIGEGLETPEQLAAFAQLGIDAGQGYIFGRPGSELLQCETAALEALQAIHGTENPPVRGTPPTLSDLAVQPVMIDEWTTGHELLELFEAESDLPAVVLRSTGGSPRVVSRDRLLRTFAEQFGLALYARKPARELAVIATCFPPETAVRDAARLVVQRRSSARTEPVVVADEHGVVGVIEALELLRAALEEEVIEARHANPLTGLPGNLRIREYFQRLGTETAGLVAIYADIDRFKQFNDHSGFGAGDLAIARLAEVLSANSAMCRQKPFVGHIGGDDFIVVISEDDLPRFRDNVRIDLSGRWFDPESLSSSPSLTVTFAGIPLSELHGKFEEQAEILSRFKAELKRQGGGYFRLAGEGAAADPGSRAA